MKLLRIVKVNNKLNKHEIFEMSGLNIEERFSKNGSNIYTHELIKNEPPKNQSALPTGIDYLERFIKKIQPSIQY